MALVVIESSTPDVEIAHKLFAVLTESNTITTSFRQQLLDVIRANVEDLYTVVPDEDE